MMYGYVGGYSLADDICYCSLCGEDISRWSADGSGTSECGFRFYVIEHEESRREE